MYQPPNDPNQYPPPPPGYQQQMYPQGQYQPMPPPKKKRTGLWIGLSILVVVLLCICAGIGSMASKGGTATNTSTLVTQVATTDTGTTPTPIATNQHYKAGQTVKIGDTWQVTLNSVKMSAGQGYDMPKSAHKYLLLNVTLKNVGGKEEDASSLLQWKLRDSEGTAYDETIVTFAASAPNGKVEPGNQIKGDLPYEVPVSQHKFTLAFQDNIFSTGQTIWDLSV